MQRGVRDRLTFQLSELMESRLTDMRDMMRHSKGRFKINAKVAAEEEGIIGSSRIVTPGKDYLVLT